MIRPIRRGILSALLMGCLRILAARATADEPKTLPADRVANRAGEKIPTKITGTFHGGELVELGVRDRIAFLVKPTGPIDPRKRWLWDFPFWLAINDGFGDMAHRYYAEKALAEGFHIAGVDVGPSCAALPRPRSARNSMSSYFINMV